MDQTTQFLSKIYSKCKQTKDSRSFYPLKGKLGSWCKECTSQYYKARYIETNAAVALRRRDRIHADPELMDKERTRCRDKQRRYYKMGYKPRVTEEQRKAHSLVSYAVKCGRISKPKHCDDCGIEAKRIHGHHEDYSKPLDVAWLCVPCHGKRHRRIGVTK